MTSMVTHLGENARQIEVSDDHYSTSDPSNSMDAT